MALTALRLKTIGDGRWGDGQGLYFRKRGSSTQWLFRWQRDGVVKEITLASGEVSLAEARSLAAQARLNVKAGKPPVTPATTAGGVTLGEAIEDFIRASRAGWRSNSEEGHTRNQLTHHCAALLSRPVTTITKQDVLSVLEPVWSQAAVSDRLLSRLSRVLGRCVALDLLVANPADPKTIRLLLPRRRAAQVHHAAVAIEDAPVVWKRLAKRTTLAARCLQLIVLTAVRSGEARGACWNEFDLKAGIWRVPASRTKTEKLLEVPLSPLAVEIVRSIPRIDDTLVFPSRTGKPLTDMSVLKEQKLVAPDTTVHGWRSCWRDRGGAVRYDRDLLELGLNHVTGAVERAYARSGHTELRRPIMVAWAEYLSG